MAFWFTPQQIDRVIRHSPSCLFGGLVLVVLQEPLPSFLVLTGFITIFLGACAGAVPSWKTEPGLWMLSGLFLFASATFYGVFTYQRVADILQGRHDPMLLVLDVTLATSLLWVQSRFLLSVTCINWLLSKRRAVAAADN